MTAKDSTDAENVEIEIQYSETVDHELIQSLSFEIENQLNAPGKTRLIRLRSLDILLRQDSASAAATEPFTTTNLVTVPPIVIVIGSVAPLLFLLGYHYVKSRIIERARIDAQNANERRKQKSTTFVTKLSVLRHADVSVSIDLHIEKKYRLHLKGKTEEAIREELYVFLQRFDGQQ